MSETELINNITGYGWSVYEHNGYLLCTPAFSGFPHYSETHDGDRHGALTRALFHVEKTMASFAVQSAVIEYPEQPETWFKPTHAPEDWTR